MASDVPPRRDYYVYMLQEYSEMFSPPGKGILLEPFYIGKGTGHRALDHFRLAELGKKGRLYNHIRYLWAKGSSVHTTIIRSGMTEQEALLLERTLIQVIGTFAGYMVNVRLKRKPRTIAFDDPVFRQERRA